MLEIRDRTILQQLHQRLPVAVRRVEAGLNMFILQYHNATIVSGRGDLGRWIVGAQPEGLKKGRVARSEIDAQGVGRRR
jgi:hypothetical protein